MSTRCSLSVRSVFLHFRSVNPAVLWKQRRWDADRDENEHPVIRGERYDVDCDRGRIILLSNMVGCAVVCCCAWLRVRRMLFGGRCRMARVSFVVASVDCGWCWDGIADCRRINRRRRTWWGRHRIDIGCLQLWCIEAFTEPWMGNLSVKESWSRFISLFCHGTVHDKTPRYISSNQRSGVEGRYCEMLL